MMHRRKNIKKYTFTSVFMILTVDFRKGFYAYSSFARINLH